MPVSSRRRIIDIQAKRLRRVADARARLRNKLEALRRALAGRRRKQPEAEPPASPIKDKKERKSDTQQAAEMLVVNPRRSAAASKAWRRPRRRPKSEGPAMFAPEREVP
ncbi:MAG TPA: hypothetical protein VH575_12310 [Gemmataceae bacterium]|jgi:hypothetical protein